MMILLAYIPLIKALIASTQTNGLKWEKGDAYQSYYTYPTNEQKILIDKFFSLVDGQIIASLDMAIFKGEEEIIDEIVLCSPMDIENNYRLLESLYSEVENQRQGNK